MAGAKRSGCRFCEIEKGAGSALVVHEDATTLAFLDRRPLFPGHCLVIPREHHETLFDLPDPLVGHLFANVRLLTHAVEMATGAEGSFVAINNRISQSVPHLHVHVVPRRRKDGLRGFFWPRHPYGSEAEARGIQAAIREAVEGLRR